MSEQVNVYEAKTRLSQLLEKAAAGDEVVIARNGKPMARLVPFQRGSRTSTFGALRGQIWMAPDFDETPEEILEDFYGDPGLPERSK